MRIAEREFRPGIVPTAAAAALFALLVALGFWQLDRARQKQELHAAAQARGQAAPLDLAAAGALRLEAAAMHWRRVRLRGHYDGSRLYLLDNQVQQGRPGYSVYSPFELDGGEARVLVSRGWVPADPDRTRAPDIATPAGAIELEGTARPVPLTPVLADTPPEDLAPGVQRLQQIDPARIGAGLLSYEVRLAGVEPGFVRNWPAPGSGRERHLGYAFQWFAMAGALLILYIFLNLKRQGIAP